MKTLFDAGRQTIEDSIRLTAESLTAHGAAFDHWCLAWSMGKDSTCALTLAVHLIESGQVPAPKSLTVLNADTRQELLPLWLAAAGVRQGLAERGIECRVVTAPLDLRMWVYILGRGVPPPNNNTLRYCTRMIKCDPMTVAVKELVREKGGRVLMLTGVRLGESAARDARIALSCSRDGAECGQGRFRESVPGDAASLLDPILHWRVCHVWAWLRSFAPDYRYGDWPTKLLADAYGGEEAEEINARTGCVCCPLASKDSALDALVAMPHWAYLMPLKGIRTLYREMREPRHRLRQPAGERRKDGILSPNQCRMGPLRLESRRAFLGRLLALQAEVNAAADRLGRPRVDHLDATEEARVRKLIAAGTWPQKWYGTEPGADEPLSAAELSLLRGEGLETPSLFGDDSGDQP